MKEIKTELGLGDLIAEFTHKLGVKKCQACGNRQELLNKVNLTFPRTRKAREFTEDEFVRYNELKTEIHTQIKNSKKHRVSTELANEIGKLWGDIFSRQPTEICATCPPTLLFKYLNDLEQVIEIYK